MEKQQNTIINPLYKKINIKITRPFKDLKFSYNQNNIFANKDKNLYSKYLIKEKEKNLQNMTLFDKSSFKNKLRNNIKKENKENQKWFRQFNKFQKIRCFSQEKIKLSSPKNKNILNNEEEDDNKDDDTEIKDINLFLDNINNEFSDIGKMIYMTYVIDEKRKYDFIKNEFVILKIVENELRDKFGLKIKEFIYNNKKLNVYKSFKENNLEDNCIIKLILD